MLANFMLFSTTGCIQLTAFNWLAQPLFASRTGCSTKTGCANDQANAAAHFLFKMDSLVPSAQIWMPSVGLTPSWVASLKRGSAWQRMSSDGLDALSIAPLLKMVAYNGRLFDGVAWVPMVAPYCSMVATWIVLGSRYSRWVGCLLLLR